MFGRIFGGPEPRPTPEPSPEVAAALLRADESVRRGSDELGFATAEFGEASTRDLAMALERARGQLQEAFRLNALLLDDEPESDEQRRGLEAAVVAAAAEAEGLVRAPAAAFATRRAALREAPAAMARLRQEAADVLTRVPEARVAVEAMSGRYDTEAVDAVAANPEQAQALLEFADRSIALAERRHATGRGSDATKAIQVAGDSVRRAEALLDAVTDHEVEAVEAESTLAAVIADSRSDLAEARQLVAARPHPQIEKAAAELETVVDASGESTARRDPFTALSQLRAANSRLDGLVQELRERPRRERQQAHLVAALGDADRQVALARALVADHSGVIGPQARTRLAQAERILDGITLVDDPQEALVQARQAADLAAEATAIAHRDLASARAHEHDAGAGWGYGTSSAGGGVDRLLGGVLGGMVLGGILDGLDDFDLD